MTTPGPPPQQPEQPGNPAGQPPSPPDQPTPYGAPNPYGAPEHPQQYGVPAPPPGGYAPWGDRAIGTLWDLVYLWPAFAAFGAAALVMAVGVGIGSAAESDGVIVVAMILGGLLLLASWILLLWRHIRNYMLDQGRTGYTYGKRKVGIRTIREDTHQPAGVASCVGRYFLHGIINQLVYIDYLWPLWDEKQQTLTDKVLTTIVVRQPDQAPQP